MKNFAQLKDTIYTSIINLLTEDRPKAKKLIKGYIQIIKSNPILKEVLHIHNNLETGSFKNEDVKHGFIVENLMALKTIDKTKLNSGLKQLDKFITENKIEYSKDLSVLSTKISDLMNNINRIDKSVENNKNVEFIIESVLNRQTEEKSDRKPITHQIFKDIMSKKYNEKFGSLSESEKKVVRGFFKGDKSLIASEYNNLTNQIRESINKKIQETEDKDTKLKLYEVKDKLINIPESITMEHFKKLYKLNENLLEKI
jgi:hypothetical protein